MPTNRLLLRDTSSPYTFPLTDIVKGSVLSWQEVDDNFIFLKGMSTQSFSVSGSSLTLQRINGDSISVNLPSFSGGSITGGTYNNTIGTLYLVDNSGSTISITGFTTGGTVGSGWGLSGNSGTTPSTNFIGTADNQPLVFRTNSTEKARITATGQLGVGLSNPIDTIHSGGRIGSGIPNVSNGSIVLYNQGNSDSINIRAQSGSTGYVLQLPSAPGGVGTVLTNDGGGVLSWATGGTSSGVIISDYTTLDTLMGISGLTTGVRYYMSDFETIYDQPDFNQDASPKGVVTTKTGNTEPLLLLAISDSEFALEAHSPLYPNDIIHYDITFDQTEANGNPAKGRITKRIDEFKNETDYDHKNVEFKRYESYTLGSQLTGTVDILGLNIAGTGTLFTSELTVGDTIVIGIDRTFVIDTITDDFNMTVASNSPNDSSASVNFFLAIPTGKYDQAFDNDTGSFVDNVPTFTTGFENYIGDFAVVSPVVGQVFLLSNNVFGGGAIANKLDVFNINNTFGDNCQTNTFSPLSFFNTYGDDCSGNDVGVFSTFNKVGNAFTTNVIKAAFGSNRIGNDFITNDIDVFFNGNTIGDNFNLNQVGVDFKFNTIDVNFEGNHVLNSFGANTIGTDYRRNNIGDSFNGNTIGDNFINNYVKNGFDSNIIGNIFQKNVIESDLNSTDFTSATLVYGDYTKEIFKRSDGAFRLRYTDAFDAIIVDDIDA